MEKILVIGGLHGNEPLGLEVVERLQKKPIPGITAIIGNPEALKQNRRFAESDLNRVFPGKENGNVEERRAVEIMKVADGFDLVLDFHNTTTSGNDCGFVGETGCVALLPIAGTLSIGRVIIADYDCVNKYVPTCLSVETSLDSDACDANQWIGKIQALTQAIKRPIMNPDLFKFVRRITRDEQNVYRFEGWKAFRPIASEDIQRLELEVGEYFPIFVDDSYTPYNFAGLIKKIS